MAKVAIVTGSSRGIGRAIAIKLAQDGYKIVTNAEVASEQLEAVTTEINELTQATSVVADISELEAHPQLITAAQNLGELHCLVNNAGVSVLQRDDLLTAAPASFDRCHQINTRGVFFLAQAFAKAVLEQPQQIPGHRNLIFITSINAQVASINRGEYCISKAATSMTAKLFAQRLAKDNIGVYEIQPGLIKTDMTAASQEKYDKLIAAGLLPLPRWGDAAEVAQVVSTLATGNMAYAVGQAIQLDGGLSKPQF